jgi:serine/threonine protein kinase
MRVCSICYRCYDTEVDYCTDESHPSLSDTHDGSCEMIAGYRLDVLLGSSLKGEVYFAQHTASGRSCRVKILPADAQNGQQFLQEAKLASGFFHPNVVDTYEAGTLASGDLYVVAEAASGQTLSEYLKTVGVPELLTSIEIVRQTAEILHAIHLKGLTHRAVNPENIILTIDTEGRPLVRIKDLDFGGVVERSIVSDKFLIDSAIDSIKYFSPEQCSCKAVSLKTDVYSLGIVLYEMLAGAPPFDAPKAAGLIEQHKKERPPEIKIDDFELRMLVTHTLMESLTKQPEKRQPSANAFARQLRHIEQLATHVSTPPPAGVAPPPPTRSAAVATTAAATAPARSAYIQPPAMAETPRAIFEHTTEPASAIDLESFADDLPEIPYLVSAEPAIEDFVPVIENFVQESSTPTARLSRMKLLRKKLHQMAALPAPEIPNNKPVPSVEPAHVMLVQAQATPAETAIVPAEPVEIAAIPVQSHPHKIEWDQPEDDIPSVADVLEVLGAEQLTEIPIVSLEAEEVPITQIEPKKTAAVAEVPKEITVDPEEPEEITVVSAPRRRIKIEWEKPAAPQGLLPDQRSSAHAWDEVTFVPTILGNARESKTIELDPEDSILSAYDASSRPGFSVPYRPLMMGGGFLVLIALLLFGYDLLGNYASTENPGDSVAAKTTSARETLPQAEQTISVSPAPQTALKNFKKPQAEDDVADTNQSKPAPINESAPLSGARPPTSASQKVGKTTPLVPSTLVISSDNGKIKMKTEPEKNSANKKPLSIADKTGGATRPRIVKDPRP